MKNSFQSKIKSLLKREFPDSPPWKGFAQWWLVARGFDSRGRNEDYLVDGSKDGGFDIIAWPLPNLDDKKIYVIQSKYFMSLPSIKSLERFVGAIEAINGSRIAFDNWIETVRDNLRNTYEKLRDNRKQVEFVFVTPAKMSISQKNYLKKRMVVFDRDEVERLYNFYIQGQTPRAKSLTLKANSKIVPISENKNEKMWVFSTPLRLFAKAYKSNGDLLFAGNIRLSLKGENAKKVRDGIMETIKYFPEEFVFSHNGITMVTKSMKISGKTIRLIDPSIVNGAQTVSHIGKNWASKIKNTNASVLVKLIQILPNGSYERIETDIAIRSNTQNKVDFSDLTVSEPALVALQKELLNRHIFLERKKGEEPPFYCRLKISKERLIQLLACVDSQLGPTDAKRKQELFKRPHALRMLRSYDDNDNPSIGDIVLLIRFDKSLHSTLDHFPNQTRKKRAKTASFAILASLCMALKEKKLWKHLKKEINTADALDFKIQEEINKLFKLTSGHLLRLSKNEKKNEPAFYKNKEQTNIAVNKTVKKLKPRSLIPMPPVAEQQRIVAKVDKLMALCDSLKERFVQVYILHEQLATTVVENDVAARKV